MNKKISTGIIIVIAFQLLVLVGMYVNAAIPVWTGTEIRVKTIPVDPRSMFRGNYARLSYAFSRLNIEQIEGAEAVRNGEVVYITLKPGKNDLYEFKNASLNKPVGEVFIRGRIKNRRGNWVRTSGRSQVRYGIEAFFAPKEKALKLEKELRDGGIAVLGVSSSGKARIIDVIGE